MEFVGLDESDVSDLAMSQHYVECQSCEELAVENMQTYINIIYF